MPNYRRWFVPGGSYFFTLVVQGRRPLFKTRQSVALLGNTMRECRSRWPLRVNAIVLLPDHLHVIWTLLPSDAEYPKRWGWIKKEFTKQWLDAHGGEQKISPGHRRERRRGVWQPRYWEHTFEDEDDLSDTSTISIGIQLNTATCNIPTNGYIHRFIGT